MSIKALLTSSSNLQDRLISETRGLQEKWKKTGLLEGLSQVDRSNMSVLLENQAKQLLDEATRTGTAANSEQWAGVALPLVRRLFAEIAAKEFVSVQPMNLPSGLIFYLDFKYGTDQAGKPRFAGESLWGGTGIKLGSTDKAVNGLYGVGRFGYSINDLSSASLSPSGTGSVSYDDVQYNADFSASVVAGGLKKVTVQLGGDHDVTGVRAFTISGSNIVDFYPQFTKAAGNFVTFVVSASAGAIAGLKVEYHNQPSDRTRGDFEDKATLAGPAGNDSGTFKDIGIPEINLDVKSEAIVAKTRKLKAVWTPELAQDLNAYHSIDAEAELTALLSEYVAQEIDFEILDMLITAAPAESTEAWSAKIGVEIQRTGVDANGIPLFNYVADSSPNRTAYVKSTWFQTLGNKIQKVSNKIHQLTLRGGANFLVVSPDVATILECIPGFTVDTDGDKSKFAMGVAKVGSLNNRWNVYKNPYMTENIMLLGFRGNNFFECGAVYSPYIPLIQTPLVYDPINFTPRRGIMTRYAKKVVRPEFYGRVFVGDLNYV